MFFAPKEIKKETGESLVYNPHRTMVSKEFTFDAAHHLFNYEGKCKSKISRLSKYISKIKSL